MDPTLQPGLGRGRVAITGTTTLAASHQGLSIDVTSGTFSLNLTAAATLGTGWHAMVYNSGSGTVTLDPNASETIRTATGTATTLALTQGQGVCLMCDGTGFDVITAIGLPMAVSTALTVNDNAFTVQDQGDTTKKFQFQASGITTATTRTLTVPDADTTLAGLSVAQSFTANQTFTADILQTGSGVVSTGTGVGTYNHASETHAGPSDITFTVTTASGTTRGLRINPTYTPSGAGAQDRRILEVIPTFSGSANNTSSIISVYGRLVMSSTATLTSAQNFTALTDLTTTGTITTWTGSLIQLTNSGGVGVVTTGIGTRVTTKPAGVTNWSSFLYGSAPSGDWCLYNNSALNNYLGTGASLINTTTDNGTDKFQVFGSGIFTAASTQDAIRIQGRAGGSSSRIATITVASLSGSVTHTLPDITGTFALLEGTQTFSGAKTFTGGVTVTTADVTITDRDVILSATTGTKFGTATTQKQAWWNATPVVQPSSTGETTGWTTGGGSAATSTDTYTGNTGTKAYTVNDLVKHLKNLGLIAAS